MLNPNKNLIIFIGKKYAKIVRKWKEEVIWEGIDTTYFNIQIIIYDLWTIKKNLYILQWIFLNMFFLFPLDIHLEMTLPGNGANIIFIGNVLSVSQVMSII